MIAYASDKGNSTNLDIWVQQVDGRGLVRVTEDPADDHDPVFSADGTQVLFRSERHEPGIYTAPAIGGEARLVVPEGRRPRVSPDGQSLMYWTGPDLPRDVRGSSDVKLWVKPLSGGEAIHIAAGCRLFEQTPVWAPDGSRILFVGACGSDLARGSLPENYGVTAWVSTVEGKGLEANRELYELWHSIHQPPIIDQWLANPSRLLIPLPRGDATSITVVPVSVDGTRVSGPPQILTFAGGNVTRISAALNRMALSAETLERRIWALPTDVKGAARGAPKQLTHGPAGEWSPSLSADGQKLSFLSLRANGARLFYKDLSTGREKEVSTEGYRYDTPMLNRAGTKILCVQYPSPSSWRDFVFEVPVSGGLSRKVWDRSTFSWLWDWSPDEATLLFHNTNTGTKSSEDWDVRALDLKSSLSRTLLLAAPERLSDAHFSHDGRWVAFEATPMMVFAAKPSSSRVYVAPFRDTSVPRSEWITVTGGTSDYSPRFTFDDSSVLFASDRDGFRCIWAQALGPDMHPNGSPIAIYHSHERRRPLGNSTAYFNWGVGPHSIVFDRTDSSGNVLLLESAGVRTK